VRLIVESAPAGSNLFCKAFVRHLVQDMALDQSFRMESLESKRSELHSA
jgi:hypothetical protein